VVQAVPFLPPLEQRIVGDVLGGIPMEEMDVLDGRSNATVDGQGEKIVACLGGIVRWE